MIGSWRTSIDETAYMSVGTKVGLNSGKSRKHAVRAKTKRRGASVSVHARPRSPGHAGALKAACPHCGARPGQPCRRLEGKRTVHRSRTKLTRS